MKNSSSHHAKISPARRKVQPHKVAQAAGASKRTKRQERARLGRNSATTRDGSTRTAAAQPSVSDPATRSREAYNEGNASLFSGQTESAIKAYQEAVRLNRKDPAGYRGLGLAYAQAGRRTEAVGAFQRYLKLAPTAKDRDIIKKRIQLLTAH
ncbi:MAG TPA: tetratricopeptide repeat protein [Polyangia bacterium]